MNAQASTACPFHHDPPIFMVDFFFKWFQIYSSDYWCSNPVRIITMGCVLVSFMEFGGVGFATNRANPCNKLENLARSHVFYKFSFCRKCRFFRNPNSCPVVQAFINPRTLCRTLIYLFNQSCNKIFFLVILDLPRGVKFYKRFCL